jgi:hypothetical protein
MLSIASLLVLPNDRDNLPACQLPINFIDGYQLESTTKFADELRVRLIGLLDEAATRQAAVCGSNPFVN